MTLANSAPTTALRPSPAQLALWGLCQMEDVGSAYNRGTALRLKGDLDAPALERALGAMLARHETLRSYYPGVDGEPSVRVRSPGPFHLEREDLAGRPDGPSVALQRAAGCLNAPFDLQVGPLFRCRLYRLAEHDHLLLVGVHEIVADGDSWRTVLLDLAAEYNAARNGDPLPPPKLGMGFFDLASRLWAALDGDPSAEREAITYWKEHLQHAPPLAFPTSRPRPPVLQHAGAAVSFQIDPGLRARLETLGREQGATPFMVFLALFTLFLARHAQQDDIVVGIVESGRADPGTEGLVGFLLNTLAIRTKLSVEMSFRDLLEAVLVNVLNGIEHFRVPFDRVVRHLGATRDPGRSPVFQAMLTFEKSPASGVEFDGLEVTEAPLGRAGSMFDLALYLVDAGPELHAELEYSTALFERRFVADCVDRLLSLMQRVAAEPDAPVSTMPLLDDQTAFALAGLHSGPRDPRLADGCFLQWLEEQVASARQRRAIEDDSGISWSYAELWDRAGGVASALSEQGIARGGRVGIHMERGAWMLAVVLGVLRHGAAYVPLDPDFPPERLAWMVADAQADAVVSDDPGARFGETPVLDSGTFHGVSGGYALNPGPGSADLAYIIYTSGSTGRPKGVEVSHGALRNFLGSMRADLGIDRADSLFAVTTLSFDIAALELFLPLCVGARVIIPGAEATRHGAALLERLEQSGATAMQATPATWRMLLDAGWNGRLRHILCGGEALSEGLAGALLERGDALWNLYGPTETTIWSTLDRVQGEGPIRVGRPVANTRVYVLDENGQMLPDGVPGEIWIAGEGLARGYHGQPELTAQRFRPDPFFSGQRMYATGDVGRWTEDGRLEHLGRRDFQVKIRGFRMELGEIEAALEALEAVRQAVVLVRGSEEDKRLVAYVVFQHGSEMLAGEIRRRLRQRLPDYMVPGLVVPLTAVPLTPNGKVDRKQLPDPFVSASAPLDYEAPEGAIEQAIAAAWGSFLDVARIGRHDNFFELGGHSLLAMRVLARLEASLPGAALQPREMYYLSLAQLAAVASSNLAGNAGRG